MIFDETSPPGKTLSEFSLSQDMSQFLSHRREISPTTPVIDTIDGLAPFTHTAFQEVQKGSNVDLFVIGRAGDGKSAISEQIIQKGRRSFPGLQQRYYNTSMGVEEARQQGLATSPFGRFTPEEYHTVSEKVVRPKLQATEETSEGQQQLRVLEFPAVEQHINLGNSALAYSAERIQRDPSYRRRLIGVVGEKALHRRNRKMREEIWQAETAEELRQVFKKYNIVPDPPHLDPLDVRQRMGSPVSMERIDADVEEQLIARQGDIRLSGIDKSLPAFDKQQLEADPELEERALADLYRLKAREWGFAADEVFIAHNKLLRRKIPYYGKMRNDPELRL